MAIYLVQHGVALEKKVDPDRPLSEQGREEVERIAAYLRQRGIGAARVCHSGKTRAVQTAQIFAEAIGSGQVTESPGMQAKDSASKFADGLADDDSLYVGHLPHMGKAASWLLTGDEGASVVDFTNGGVLCLQKDDDGYAIAWYLTPAMCP